MNRNTDDIFSNIDAVNVKERRVSGGGRRSTEGVGEKGRKEKGIFF